MLFLGVLIGTSCDRNRVFEENRDLSNYAWRVAEKPTFLFAITDTAARYTVYLNVRTTASYPFYNLFAKLTLTAPDGQRISRRLHEMNVRDAQTGRPLGDGAGDIFDHQFVALRGVVFPRAGTYRAELEQYMRLGVLPDVMSVGVRVAREIPVAPVAR
ncbi:MAG: gliding motility lipoprotein GldH [Hymenobacteraceae bacterium]|nr:gliding motility lipoprotein GldH [Hymenobacteraceae bacterium]